MLSEEEIVYNLMNQLAFIGECEDGGKEVLIDLARMYFEDTRFKEPMSFIKFVNYFFERVVLNDRDNYPCLTNKLYLTECVNNYNEK